MKRSWGLRNNSIVEAMKGAIEAVKNSRPKCLEISLKGRGMRWPILKDFKSASPLKHSDFLMKLEGTLVKDYNNILK